jgi:hypothetical protein
MTTITKGLVRTVALAGAFLAIGANAGSATPASPDKGLGCYVRDANAEYTFDPARRRRA